MRGGIMLKVDELGLLKADLAKGINLFTGAGFSTLARNSRGETLPVGNDLKTLLVKEFKLEAYIDLDLPSLYAIILADRRAELREYLKQTYLVKTYNSKYDSLRKLQPIYLYTTNIDDLPFHIFDARPNEDVLVLHDRATYGAPRRPSDVIQLVALHGNVRHQEADFLFTPGQISSAFASDRETWYVFQRELQSRPTLFLGYGMRDAGVLQALHDGSTRAQFNRWILLQRADAAASALYRSLGFHIMVGETEDFLSFVDTELDSASTGRASSTLKTFTGLVPNVGQVAQRPIRKFFLGAEPEWSDAYSNQVLRRRVNSSVKNSIYNGQHVAIVGVPLSGKTTILKQVAADIAGERPVLYFDRLSDPQVDKIVTEHLGEELRPLIFLDNLIDSRDAINRLVAAVGAQIVAAEQSIYFDSVSLKAIHNKLDVHSSSPLHPSDLQSIIDSIPSDIRRWKSDSTEDIERDIGELGLFETFRRHVFDEALTVRFRQKLAEFEARDQQAFDVYVMACYVAACRTIVSFDMIYTFLSSTKKEYSDVYDVIKRIDSFLIEVDLADDPHQDHFSVRSSALARVALHECQPRAFGRVFERFHSSVPQRLIVDYPVFRRYAYDNDFARKAYPRVEDGLKFYERLVKSTDNAYDYQHGAIYLSKMRSFTAAFSWIDTALSKSRGRIYTIRNTHARILFEANIDVFKQNTNDVTALEAISTSMDVLRHCIDNDPRRSYHLLRFCDQALQYGKILNDEKSMEWLTHAHNSLSLIVDEAKQSNSRESYNLTKYQRLLTEVRLAMA